MHLQSSFDLDSFGCEREEAVGAPCAPAAAAQLVFTSNLLRFGRGLGFVVTAG